MLLRITHETRYDYSPAVGTAQHILHLQPRDTLRQKLVQYQLQITPEPAQASVAPSLNLGRLFWQLLKQRFMRLLGRG